MKQWSLLGVALVVAVSAKAYATEPVCELFPSEEAAIAEARRIEAACLAAGAPADPTVECLDEAVELWWHCIGDYREIIRLNQTQLDLGPSELGRRLDLMSNMAWLSYSIEVDQMQSGELGDFTMWTSSHFTNREKEYGNEFFFFHFAVDYPVMIVSHKTYGTEATKKTYYALLKRYFARSEQLYPGLVESGMSEEQLAQIRLQMGSTRKTLAKYSYLDN